MILKLTILLVSTVLSGLWWEVGSNAGMVFNLLIRPAILSLLAVVLWPDASFMRKAPVAVASVAVANAVAATTYALQTEPWYVLSDAETQLWLAIALCIEIGVCLALLRPMEKLRNRWSPNHTPEDIRRSAPKSSA